MEVEEMVEEESFLNKIYFVGHQLVNTGTVLVLCKQRLIWCFQINIMFIFLTVVSTIYYVCYVS